MPLIFNLPRWEPVKLFLESLSFTANTLTWPFAFCVVTLTLAIILTAPARENFPAPIPWAIALALGGLGLLAVLADNPLSLLMIWAAIDLTELVTQLRLVDKPQTSEKVVIAFTTRVIGSSMLLWANIVSISTGSTIDFQNAPPETGFFLLLAAGLRIGVLPLHLPYASESAIRRGFGTALRLISTASSLILLARIPVFNPNSIGTFILLTFSALAAVYGSWMWLRAPDELTARPFWLIGLAALAVASALRDNPIGAIGWSCAMLLSGGGLFLYSAYHNWLSRALWIGIFGITALPFSITATGWGSSMPSFGLVWPFLLLAQALLLAGYIKHAMRPTLRTNFENLDPAARYFYPMGIGLLLVSTLILGVWGWGGALQVGTWFIALIGLTLGGIVVWLAPRLRILTPARAHWVGSTATSWMDWSFQGLWNLYRFMGRLSNAFSSLLEGDGGFMWTLLFLVLFISLLSQGS